MAELFRFRCFQCQKLMGAPPSKFGKIVKCPRCGVDLVVPTPGLDDAPDEANDDEENAYAVNLEDLGVNLDPLPPRRSAATSLLDPGYVDPQTNPIAFLESAPVLVDPIPDDETVIGATPPPGVPEVAVPIDIKPQVSPITGRRPIASDYDLSGRRRDVVLPRTVVLAWAMSALLGLGFAFIAGILIGHYLWR